MSSFFESKGPLSKGVTPNEGYAGVMTSLIKLCSDINVRCSLGNSLLVDASGLSFIIPGYAHIPGRSDWKKTMYLEVDARHSLSVMTADIITHVFRSRYSLVTFRSFL